MILGYKQKFPSGSPTLFKEKIFKNYENDFARTKFKMTPDQLMDYFLVVDKINPKIHSIREDKHSRWSVGMKIHHSYNTRRPDFECFFENECVLVQPIQIIKTKEIGQDELGHDEVIGTTRTVIIGGMVMPEAKIKELAINDGFDSVDHFFEWFNEDFSGKIIHWTNHKY